MVDHTDKIDHLENECAELRKLLRLLMQINAAAQESTDCDYFLNRCLEEICTIEHWEIGQAWFVENEVITCHPTCVYASREMEAMRADSLERRFTIGIGLPGRVWGTSSAVHIPDVGSVTGLTFPRAQVVTKTGVPAAFALPLSNGTDCLGVLEFFSAVMAKPSHETQRFFEKLGTLIGTYYSQKKTEHELRRSELRHGLILDHAHNAFIAMDTAGSIIHWNAKAEKFFAWRRAEVIGKTLAEVIIPPEHRQAHSMGLQRYMSTGQGPILDMRILTQALHKDGHRVNIELTVFAVPTGDDRIFGAFIVNMDEENTPPLELH